MRHREFHEPAPEDAALLAEAERTLPGETLAGLTVERLAALSRLRGLEFATALLQDRLSREPAHAAFRERVHVLAREVASLANPVADIIGIVPGAFHGHYRHTGADGVRLTEIVRGLAPRVEVLPTLSFGPLQENADLILEWLERRRGARIVLATLSKGGADLKVALGSARAAAAFESVHAWVNFSGIVHGSPLVAWLRERPLRSLAVGLVLRFQGNRLAVVDELRRAPDSPLAGWPALPRHLRVAHVYGCPLARHVRHRWAPRGHERLSPCGPNDGGGVLLGDLGALPGAVYSIWGVDHYLEPDWDIAPLLRAAVVAAASA